MNKTYADKLRDPKWQKKRLEMLEKAGWKCERCGTNESELHVHHKGYVKDREPWDYKDWVYVVVCDQCHKIEHERMQDATAFLYYHDLHIDIGMCNDGEHGDKLEFLAATIKFLCEQIYNREV
jgi:hypothetical protein